MRLLTYLFTGINISKPAVFLRLSTGTFWYRLRLFGIVWDLIQTKTGLVAPVKKLNCLYKIG